MDTHEPDSAAPPPDVPDVPAGSGSSPAPDTDSDPTHADSPHPPPLPRSARWRGHGPEPSPAPAAAVEPVRPDEIGLGRLFDLVLRRPDRLRQALLDPGLHHLLTTRLLLISLAGFTLFGLATSVIFHVSGPLPLGLPHVSWRDGSALAWVAAVDLGLIAALGICLPSFYFYGLLAGVRTTMVECVVHALRSTAVAATITVGILPIYVAVFLAFVLFDSPPGWEDAGIVLGLALPLAGCAVGLRSMVTAFSDLAARLPRERQEARRCFLGRLLVSWSGVYTAVAPVMVATLWRHFAGA